MNGNDAASKAAEALKVHRFVRIIFWVSIAAMALMVLGRLPAVVRYATWERVPAIYLGSGNRVVASGNRSATCSRSYQLTENAEALPLVLDAPCLLLLPRGEPGKSVSLAVDEGRGRGYSSAEAFGVGGYELGAVVFVLVMSLLFRSTRRALASRS